MISNLSKKFRYINEQGGELIFDPDHGYIINKPEGIDTLMINLNEAQGIDQVGSSVQSVNVQPRAVVITGKVIGPEQAYRKEQLLAVVRPDLNARLYADDYYLNVRLTMAPSISPAPRFADFTFSLCAPYPYWQKDEKASVELSSLEYKFRLPCNFSKPYRFAKLTEKQFFVITNRGQLPIPFKVIFIAKGPVVNPKITSATTGEYLYIKKSMVEGERIVVDISHNLSHVDSTVDGDIRGALTLSSRLTRLQVGDNVLKPEAEAGRESLQIVLEYATEVVGVTL